MNYYFYLKIFLKDLIYQYKKCDDLKFFSDEELIHHWYKHGKYESRIYSEKT